MKNILSVVALLVAVSSGIAVSRVEKNLYTLSNTPSGIRECSLIECTSLPGPAVLCPNPEVKYIDLLCTKVFSGPGRYTIKP